jgi:DNA-nicking Smr family endonuclease
MAQPGADDEDLRAFREEVKDVAPIRVAPRIEQPVRKPPPVPVQSLLDDQAALADSLSDPLEGDVPLEIGEELTYHREGVPAQTLRRLRRGEWSIQDDLDLHNLTTVEARAALAAFLNLSVRRGVRCVRIVHGKGYRSSGGQPVLKGRVAHWLRQRDEVLAYVQARPVDGGGGAVLVLLRGSGRGV